MIAGNRVICSSKTNSHAVTTLAHGLERPQVVVDLGKVTSALLSAVRLKLLRVWD